MALRFYCKPNKIFNFLRSNKNIIKKLENKTKNIVLIVFSSVAKMLTIVLEMLPIGLVLILSTPSIWVFSRAFPFSILILSVGVNVFSVFGILLNRVWIAVATMIMAIMNILLHVAYFLFLYNLAWHFDIFYSTIFLPIIFAFYIAIIVFCVIKIYSIAKQKKRSLA